MLGLVLLVGPVRAEELLPEEATSAEELANPVSSRISVPFQYNWDSGFGCEDKLGCEKIRRSYTRTTRRYPRSLGRDNAPRTGTHR